MTPAEPAPACAFVGVAFRLPDTLGLLPVLYGARSHGSYARCLTLRSHGRPCTAQDSLPAVPRSLGRAGLSPAGIHHQVSSAAQLMASSSLRLSLVHQN